MPFLVIARQISSNSEVEVEYQQVVGEFDTIAQADAAIVAAAENLQFQLSGGKGFGIRFYRIEYPQYIKEGGKFYIEATNVRFVEYLLLKKFGVDSGHVRSFDTFIALRN